MKYLIQFEFRKNKKSTYWLPLFFETEEREIANKMAKTVYTLLNDSFEEIINYSINTFNQDVSKNELVKNYIEDERVGECEILKISSELKIDPLDNDIERKIAFQKDFFLKEFDEKEFSSTNFKKNLILTRKISDNINNFDEYLVVKLKRKAAIIMEPKKNPKADLEKLRSTFTLAGLVVSLFIVYSIINWRFYDIQAAELGELIVDEEEEDIIPITEQNTPPPPPPPPPAAPEVIEIVEDDEEVEDIEIEDTEADAETVVEIFEQEEEVVEDEIFTVVESPPEFPGGTAKLFEYLGKNIKYPPAAKANGISGRVFVNFVVGKDGKPRDVKILRGVHELLDKEAIRVVKSFPDWKPGKQRGKAVSVSFNLPINFVLK